MKSYNILINIGQISLVRNLALQRPIENKMTYRMLLIYDKSELWPFIFSFSVFPLFSPFFPYTWPR